MTLIVPPGFGLAAWIFTSASGTPPFVTTLGVDLSEAGGDFVGAANDLMQRWITTFNTQQDSDLTLDRVNLRVGQDGPSGSVDSTLAPSGMTRSGTSTAWANSILVRKVTNELGRRGRGRMFAPGFLNNTEVEQDGSILATRRTTISGLLSTFFDALATPTTDTAYPPVLLHSAAPADPTPITDLVLSDLIGIQRGRIR